MIQKISLVFLTALSLQAEVNYPLLTGSSVVPQDKEYFTHKLKKNDVELIYTQNNLPFAEEVAAIEVPLHKEYEYFYGWKLDERLYVGLISDKNQIANGFSTQWPNNRQINYVGGAEKVDYFCSTSWLDTLLYHETAHNYQTNVKGNIVSQTLHTLFGNGYFLFPITVPNLMENSFMLEGNAVLNESWHGNGGRLYSGRFQAQTLLQAKADNINAAYVYNSRLAFPYGESYYIVGGFYNLYMAEHYGLKKINSYFKAKSKDWFWPFLTNKAMKNATGSDFEETLDAFAQEQKEIAKNFIEAKGKRVATSQFFSSLGNDKDEIFFITNESGREFPSLVRLDKANKKVTKKSDSWLAGKVLKVNGEYYTQSSRKTSPLRREQGLFSSSAFIKKGTGSKIVQSYLSDGKEVSFDVASSYSEPQLCVDGKFYAQVNSSVIVDKEDNLYYFVQNGKRRTLYKNRVPLYSYKGFYGLVSDVDSKGGVYFVANSKLGSTLYRYRDGVVSRVSRADNVVEARLVNDDEVLIAAIGAKEYYYLIKRLEKIEEKPYERKLFFEKKPYYGAYKKDVKMEKLDLNNSYSSFLNMHYSGTDFSYGVSVDGSSLGSLNINFSDPLTQNSLNAFMSRDESNITIAGAGYSSSQYLLEYQVIAYGVIDKDIHKNVRDSGVIAKATLPFLESGYFYGAVSESYYQDYDTFAREPLSTTLTLSNTKQFGVSMYANSLNRLDIYGVLERGDKIAGAQYQFEHSLPAEFYVSAGVKYSETDSKTGFVARGVKLSSSTLSADMDPSTIDMPSFNRSAYVKSAGYGELSLTKVFNRSAYFFTFPFSLQRESLYMNYRHYEIKNFSADLFRANEERVGATLSTVLMNSLPLPISFEYIHNDASFIEEKSSFRFLLGSSF